MRTFVHEVASPAVVSLAVASGSIVFIFRFMRPFRKFVVPPVKLDPREVGLWSKAGEGELDISGLHDGLETLKASLEADSSVMLSTR